MGKVYFSKVGLQNLMLQCSQEMKSIGIALGFSLAETYLEKIAAHAVKIGDKTLIAYCNQLGLYKQSDELDKETQEILTNEDIEEKGKTNEISSH